MLAYGALIIRAGKQETRLSIGTKRVVKVVRRLGLEPRTKVHRFKEVRESLYPLLDKGFVIHQTSENLLVC